MRRIKGNTLKITCNTTQKKLVREYYDWSINCQNLACISYVIKSALEHVKSNSNKMTNEAMSQ